ncbi:MAG: Fic family protein [Planctomycetaceae bacterium]
MTRQELQEILGLKHEEHFREAYVVPALTAGYIQMTVPEKPRSKNQRYRLTSRGQRVVALQRSVKSSPKRLTPRKRH